jgi:arylsulfatase A-like enzyme
MRARFSPEYAGYDESDGDTGNNHGDLMTDKDDKWETHFVVNDPKRMLTLTGRATNFMQRQVKSGNPFYLQVSHYATHVDFQMRETTYKKYLAKSPGAKHGNPAFAAMLEDLDESIGRILDEVERLGISDNTFIFFMADNGATEFLPPVKNRLDPPASFKTPMRNYPLRGGKWTLYEGGIRVPLIVRGPGVAANSQCDVPVAGWDLLATFASLAANTDRSFEVDGGSFAGLLKNKGHGNVNRPLRDFVFHRYNNSYPHSALIAGDLKVIKFWKTDKVELYNLREDPGEVHDLAGTNPKEAHALAARLAKYLDEVNPGLTTGYKK